MSTNMIREWTGGRRGGPRGQDAPPYELQKVIKDIKKKMYFHGKADIYQAAEDALLSFVIPSISPEFLRDDEKDEKLKAMHNELDLILDKDKKKLLKKYIQYAVWHAMGWAIIFMLDNGPGIEAELDKSFYNLIS